MIEKGINTTTAQTPFEIQSKGSIINGLTKSVIDFSTFNELKPGQRDTSIIDPELLKYKIGANTVFPDIEFLLKYNDKGCFPRGDIQMINAPPKSGKTFVCTFIEFVMLKGQSGGFIAQRREIRVLVIDTEQNPVNVNINRLKVHALCGLSGSDYPRFNVYSLRELSYLERREKLEEAIKEHNPDIVILDGIRDLLRDFNSIAETAEVIELLMRLTTQYKTAICGVLHQNKTDQNARGHIGSELLAKCSDVYNLKKDGDTITVDQTYSRNPPIEKFAITIDANGLPQLSEMKPKVSRGTEKEIKIRKVIDNLFGLNANYRPAKLYAAYMECTGCSISTAKRDIESAEILRIIIQRNDLSYVLLQDN